MTQNTLSVLKINGPIYHKVINGKDLVADLLPPPAYIIESYLLIFELLEIQNSGKRSELVAKGSRLQGDFERRFQYWDTYLPEGEIRNLMLGEVALHARNFFEIRDQRFLPALDRGEVPLARSIAILELSKHYRLHRSAVDKVVRLAEVQNRREEVVAADLIRVHNRKILLLGTLTLIVTLAAAIWVARGIFRPLSRLDEAMALQEKGLPHTTLEDLPENELGRLAKTFNRMTDAITARTSALQTLNVELSSANRELDSFTHSVSHDLRTPLRGIKGLAKALGEEFQDRLPREAGLYLERIQSDVHRMESLIEDLLEFSRQSRKELCPDRISINDVVHHCLEALTEEQRNRKIEFQISPLPPCLGDEALITQVFLNLISNALKFSRRREPAKVEIAGVEKENWIHYTVRDNGEGFDMRYADKLFKVFQRLHGTEVYEGTGVGLALVNQIVSRHGGRVWAESRPGDGASFSFTLPSTTFTVS